MNIASIVQLQNIGRNQVVNNNKKSSFKDFLPATVNNNKLSNELNTDKNTKSASSLKEVINDIQEHLEDKKLDIDILEDQTQYFGSEYYVLMINEVQQLNGHASSLEELINSAKNLPGAIGILTLVNVLPTNGEIDFTDIMSKLNQLLKAEFPSYTVPNELNLKNMLYAIDHMQLEDKALLEGQLLLSSLDDQLVDDLRYSGQLLGHIEKTSDFKSVKDIIKGIFTEGEANENLKALLSSDDLTKIRSLINKLVNTVNSIDQNLSDTDMTNLSESTFSIQLDKFVNKDQLITVDGQKNGLTSTNEEFTNQMLAIMRKGKFTQFGNGTNRLVINLTPEHLGSITIKILQQNGKMVAKIIAATQSAKELLDHSAQQLKQAMPTIKVEIERFEVMTEQNTKPYKENQDTNENKERNDRDSTSNTEEESQNSFRDSLNDALNITV